MKVFEILREEEFKVEPNRPGNRGRIRGYNVVSPDGDTQRFSTKADAQKFANAQNSDLRVRNELAKYRSGGKIDGIRPKGTNKWAWQELVDGKYVNKVGSLAELETAISKVDTPAANAIKASRTSIFKRAWAVFKRSPFFILGAGIISLQIHEEFTTRIASIKAVMDSNLSKHYPAEVKQQITAEAIQATVIHHWSTHVVNVTTQIAAAASAGGVGRKLQQGVRWLRGASRATGPIRWFNPWTIAGGLAVEGAAYLVTRWFADRDSDAVAQMFKDATDAVFNVIGIAVDTGIAAVDSVSISNGEVIDELKDAAGDGDADDIDLDDLENSVQSSSQSNGNAAGTPTNTKPETADDMEDKLKNLEKF
jgi:hypothetical protein